MRRPSWGIWEVRPPAPSPARWPCSQPPACMSLHPTCLTPRTAPTTPLPSLIRPVLLPAHPDLARSPTLPSLTCGGWLLRRRPKLSSQQPEGEDAILPPSDRGDRGPERSSDLLGECTAGRRQLSDLAGQRATSPPVCPPVCPARAPACRCPPPSPSLTGPHPPSGPSILELMHLAHWGARRRPGLNCPSGWGGGAGGHWGGLPQAGQGCTGLGGINQ